VQIYKKKVYKKIFLLKKKFIYLYNNNKTIEIMTTIQSHKAHTKVAKILRYAGYKATCVRNENFDFNNYEVQVKGINESELKELYNVVFGIFNNTMINLIAK
jgi:diphthamide synthase subunit DPH2